MQWYSPSSAETKADFVYTTPFVPEDARLVDPMNHLKDSIVSTVVDPATQVKVSVEPVRTSPLDGVAWIVGLLGTGAKERIKNTLIWTYIDSLRLFASRGKLGENAAFL
jgi:hypothetical protein